MTRAWLVVLTLEAACSNPTSSNACITGSTQACTCTSGASGAQTCLSDGTFGACSCMGGPADASVDSSRPVDSRSTTPTAIATGQTFAFAYGIDYACNEGLLLDATSAYWFTSDGAVRSVPLSGGTVLTLASGFQRINGFTSDDDSLFVSTSGTSTGGAAGIYKIPKIGGTVTTPLVPLTAITGTTSFASLASDGASLYFVYLGSSSGIGKTTTSGASPTSLGTATFRTPYGSGVTSTPIRLDTDALYYLDGSGNLGKMTVADGMTSTVATTSNFTWAGPMVVDSANVYWFDGTGMEKIPKTGAATVELISMADTPTLVVDSGTLYFGGTPPSYTAMLAGLVAKVSMVSTAPPTAPTTASPFTSAAGSPFGVVALASDATNVYWCDSDGKVYSLAK